MQLQRLGTIRHTVHRRQLCRVPIKVTDFWSHASHACRVIDEICQVILTVKLLRCRCVADWTHDAVSLTSDGTRRVVGEKTILGRFLGFSLH